MGTEKMKIGVRHFMVLARPNIGHEYFAAALSMYMFCLMQYAKYTGLLRAHFFADVSSVHSEEHSIRNIESISHCAL